MDEAKAFELLGRKQAALDDLNSEFNRLLVILNKIVIGEIEPEHITVDLLSRSWRYDVPPEKPVKLVETEH